MAYTKGITLEQEYTAPPTGNTFSYANLQISESFPDEAQLIVRWQMTTVTTPGGEPVQTEGLTSSLREQLFNLDNSYLTFNPTALTVTVDGPAISGATVTVTDGFGVETDYVYPSFTLINNVNPVFIRRSVNVSNPIVDFQAGSRLTSGQLNAGVQQLLFAAQEQTVFGTSSDLSSVDLGTESINNLGDVNINTNNSGALLVVNANGTISDSTTSDTNAVLSVNAKTGTVVLDNEDVGAAATVHTHVMTDITDLNISGIGGIDLAVLPPVAGDTLVFDGVDWVPGQPVTVSGGVGAPPASWTDDPARRPGDLYVRTG